MKLTLLHKGLLLVSIPLCFEITIFAVLLNLQDQIEREAQRVNRNKQITDGINGIIHDLLSITHTFETDPRNPSPYNEPTVFKRMIMIKRQVNETSARFKQIEELAKDDPVLSAQIKKCGAGIVRAKQDLMDFARQVVEPHDPRLNGRYKAKLTADFQDSLTNGLLELGESAARGTNDVTSPLIREQIRLLLKLALTFSVLFALFCATIFSRQLANRLSLVSENADKLAKGEPLLEPLGGTDEVAELDSHLHAAADLIEAAKKMRQEVNAMITHDLKSPLQSVRSYLEMLGSGLFGELNPQGKRLLATTESASEHMVGLIDSVLQLEKMRTGNIELNTSLVEISVILEKCLRSTNVSAEAKGIELVTDFTSDECDVSGDAFWLQEVFVNILSNAVKYSPKNSKVSLKTRVIDKEVEISIADQGPGISKQEIGLIFERFHRIAATSDISGTGLGLPIAKQLVEMHKGSIKVESDGSTGSTFIISLPIWRPV